MIHDILYNECAVVYILRYKAECWNKDGTKGTSAWPTV